jgi:hypothetical protein
VLKHKQIIAFRKLIMEHIIIYKTQLCEPIARFDINQKMKAIEYIKKLNRSNGIANELFHSQKKINSYDKFIEHFSLNPKFEICRDYSIVRKSSFPNQTSLKSGKVGTRPRVSLV